MNCLHMLDTLTREHFHNIYWLIYYFFLRIPTPHIEVYYPPLKSYIDARIYQLVKQINIYGIPPSFSCESMDGLYQVVVRLSLKDKLLCLLNSAEINRIENESETIFCVRFNELEHDRLLKYLLNAQFSSVNVHV